MYFRLFLLTESITLIRTSSYLFFFLLADTCMSHGKCVCLSVCMCTQRSSPVQAQVGSVSFKPPSRLSAQGGAAQMTRILTQEGGSTVWGGRVSGAHHHGLWDTQCPTDSEGENESKREEREEKAQKKNRLTQRWKDEGEGESCGVKRRWGNGSNQTETGR